MAEEFQGGICGGNWWNLSRSVFKAAGGSSPCSTVVNDMGNYGWSSNDHLVGLKARSCGCGTETTNLVSHSSMVFQDNPKCQNSESTYSGLQIMGFGLSSSSASNWNQSFLGDCMLQAEDMEAGTNMNYQHETTAVDSSLIENFSGIGESSSINTVDQLDHQDLFLDQERLNSLNCSNNTSTSYLYPSSSSSLLQNLLDTSDFQPQQSFYKSVTCSSTAANFGTDSKDLLPSCPKFDSYLKPSLPKHQQSGYFSSNTPFWNASMSSSHSQFLTSTFEQKPKCHSLTTKLQANISEDVQDSGTGAKKNGGSSEPVFKRPRMETPSPLPTFKVRKEKLGDRVTALQQLVSPFGKTDTASVLHEAIEYIKLLHDQVSVLSSPYMKSGAPIAHQQGNAKLNNPEGPKQDLRSRGLCLVPISSTFAVANETASDVWTPTFGGNNFR